MKPWVRLCMLASLAGPAVAAPPVAVPVDPMRMNSIVREMTEVTYEGRAPGTNGEERSVGYLVRTLKALGIPPGGEDGSYIQQVPLIRTRISAGAALNISVGGAAVQLAQGQGAYFSTVRGDPAIAIRGAPLVFVGYGVTAPERGWDDFKGVDLKGKVAVILINDPDFEAKPGEPVADKFGGRRETYYGRWKYKYEEAARRGAIAALIIHDAPGAGYGWETVIAGGSENYAPAPGEGQPPRLALQGWTEGAAAADLFKHAGLDLASARAAARRADFRPMPLGDATLSASVPVTVTELTSRNVLGRIAGTTHPDETIMFGAHWDAYGLGAPDAQGRTMRPGAADDAVGVAGELELARLFKAGPPPQRSLVFAFWTAEERGLLGSEAYAAHPLYPLEKTVANLTIDVLQTAGAARDVVLVGNGQSDLDDALARAAAAQGRTVTPEALPERGLYFRADHFSVARRGVPAMLLMGMSGGHDLVKGGRKAGDKWLVDYMKCYHQTCDLWDPKWDLTGAAQDVALYYAIGGELANSRVWPAWRDDSEFKVLRDKSASERR